MHFDFGVSDNTNAVHAIDAIEFESVLVICS